MYSCIFPLNGCQIVCSKSFFDNELQIHVYHGDFLLMDNRAQTQEIIRH